MSDPADLSNRAVEALQAAASILGQNLAHLIDVRSKSACFVHWRTVCRACDACVVGSENFADYRAVGG
jgi:hypothetical protein